MKFPHAAKTHAFFLSWVGALGRNGHVWAHSQALFYPGTLSEHLLWAKDPKVQHARVCETVAGLVLQGTQVTNADPWMCNKEVLHMCRQLAVIMKDVEESLNDVWDDFEGMRTRTEIAVEATTLGIKPSQA